jgi:hypothetical protein
MFMFGAPSEHVLNGGVWGYLTHPIFLLEPLLVSLAVGHWIIQRSEAAVRFKQITLCGLASASIIFSAAFIFLLPTLQGGVARAGR